MEIDRLFVLWVTLLFHSTKRGQRTVIKHCNNVLFTIFVHSFGIEFIIVSQPSVNSGSLLLPQTGNLVWYKNNLRYFQPLYTLTFLFSCNKICTHVHKTRKLLRVIFNSWLSCLTLIRTFSFHSLSDLWNLPLSVSFWNRSCRSTTLFSVTAGIHERICGSSSAISLFSVRNGGSKCTLLVQIKSSTFIPYPKFQSPCHLKAKFTLRSTHALLLTINLTLHDFTLIFRYNFVELK